MKTGWMMATKAKSAEGGVKSSHTPKDNVMRPSEALKIHRASLLSIAAARGIHNVRVFGSVLRGDDTDRSDIDLLVDVPDDATLLDMVSFQRALEAEIGVSVDVLTPDDLPARFRNSVLAEAKPL
jgi:predicted nucleotidyltransferase